jgi:hypothetical protein
MNKLLYGTVLSLAVIGIVMSVDEEEAGRFRMGKYPGQ